MYLADTRGTKAAVAPDTGPGRRPAAVPGTVLALGTVSLITDISSEMVTAVLPLYLVAGLGLSPLGFGLLDGVYNGVGPWSGWPAATSPTGAAAGTRWSRASATASPRCANRCCCSPTPSP